MKKGLCISFLIISLSICLLYRDFLFIYAEEADKEETTSVEQVQEQETDSSSDDELSVDEVLDNSDNQEEQSKGLSASTAELGITEVTAGIEYKASLFGVSEEAIDNVVFKVWSEQKGEDDVLVYVAEKEQDGSFSSSVIVKQHKHLGLFHVVAYEINNSSSQNEATQEDLCAMLENQNDSTELASATFETLSPQGGLLSASANKTKGTITVKLSGIENNDLVREIRFHIWSKNNQSDFKDYIVKRNKEGVYSTVVYLKDFLNSPGIYEVRAYSVDVVNGLRFHGKASVNMLASTSAVNVTTPSGNPHFRTITATGVEAPCGVDKVRFAVWSSSGGQDDLKWYTATKSGSAYQYTVDVRNHNSVGSYNAHVYVVSKNGVSRCTKKTTFSVSSGDLKPNPIKGIDISKHNGTIDWAKVKNSGIKFAVIRCGYGDNISSQDDIQWTRNVAQCESIGMPYGVYIYSYATSVAQAKSEAEHCIRLLKGHKPQYPVFLDLEDESMSGLSNAQLLQITVTWAEKIKAAGYTPGVYSSKSWWTTRLTSSNYNNYKRWVAQWNTQCTYAGTYCMWQYSSKGTVNGISGYVDMDYAY